MSYERWEAGKPAVSGLVPANRTISEFMDMPGTRRKLDVPGASATEALQRSLTRGEAMSARAVRADVVRPFWRGGDYEAFEYLEGCVVVDNLPFSIHARIQDFYLGRGIGLLITKAGRRAHAPYGPRLILVGPAGFEPATWGL